MTESEKKQLFLARLRTAACVLIALAVVIAVITALPRAYSALNELEAAAKGLQEIAVKIDDADLPGMAEDMDRVLGETGSLIEDGHRAVDTAVITVEAALEKIEALDVDTLNKAIGDFSAVVEPLARLFGR